MRGLIDAHADQTLGSPRDAAGDGLGHAMASVDKPQIVLNRNGRCSPVTKKPEVSGQVWRRRGTNEGIAGNPWLDCNTARVRFHV